MPDPRLSAAGDAVEKRLHDRGLAHWSVRVYGGHIIIHPADHENRARLTELRSDHDRLDMAARNRWEPTPYVGTWQDLLTHLIDESGFLLVPWSYSRRRRRERTSGIRYERPAAHPGAAQHSEWPQLVQRTQPSW